MTVQNEGPERIGQLKPRASAEVVGTREKEGAEEKEAPTAIRVETIVQAKFFTVAALYILPITIGLRSESSLLSPNNILMLALNILAISRIMNVRQAVRTDEYNHWVMSVDIVMVLLLAVMFHCLARPAVVGQWLVDFAAFKTPRLPQVYEVAAIKNTWQLFWGSSILFFILLAVWTGLVYKFHGLKRKNLWRYAVGWALGGLVSLAMLIFSTVFDAEATYKIYFFVAVGLSGVTAWFFLREMKQGDLFEVVHRDRS